MDDPSFVAMAGVDLIFRHTLDSSLEWIQGHIRIATAEFKQRLDMAANDKKRDLRQEVISLANVIHDKLKVETDAINRPILARIEDLRQISVSIGANYSQYRWHDRIIGLLCASLLFLAAIAFGMMFVLFKR